MIARNAFQAGLSLTVTFGSETAIRRQSMITKQQLDTLHDIQEHAVEENDMRLYYAIDLAISAALRISEPYHQKAVERAVQFNKPQ